MSTTLHFDAYITINNSDVEAYVLARVADEYGVDDDEITQDCESYASDWDHTHEKGTDEERERLREVEAARQAWGWNAKPCGSVGEMGWPLWMEMLDHLTVDNYIDWIMSGDCDDPEDIEEFLSAICDAYLSL